MMILMLKASVVIDAKRLMAAGVSTLVVTVVLLALAACGQKGALALPKPPAGGASAPAQPVTTPAASTPAVAP
jgi:predicted small lipoprotein YifL